MRVDCSIHFVPTFWMPQSNFIIAKYFVPNHFFFLIFISRQRFVSLLRALNKILEYNFGRAYCYKQPITCIVKPLIVVVTSRYT